MNNFYKKYLLLLIGLMLLTTQCGFYSFSGSTLPPHIKTVAVPLFEDKTAEFGIDQQLTDALIEAIIMDNTLQIADLKDANAVLTGTITRVEERAGAYSEDEEASDFNIYVSVKVTFEDRVKRRVMWEQSLSEFGTFQPGDRQTGLDEAIEKLTTKIINQMVSNW